jgi:alkylhydroperoxidase family enzyme
MVDAIATADASSLFTVEEKAVVAASTELTKIARLSDAMFERLKRHFDERQILELVINTSIANLNNRVTDAFQADVEPDQ